MIVITLMSDDGENAYWGAIKLTDDGLHLRAAGNEQSIPLYTDSPPTAGSFPVDFGMPEDDAQLRLVVFLPSQPPTSEDKNNANAKSEPATKQQEPAAAKVASDEKKDQPPIDLDGPWIDVDAGHCPRRLYSPRAMISTSTLMERGTFHTMSRFPPSM